jgi:hypothetical protein
MEIKHLDIQLSHVDTKELLKWLNSVGFTRHIFIGVTGEHDFYLFAMDYYERFTLVRSIRTPLKGHKMSFSGLTIGIEKESLVDYFKSILVNTPNMPSKLTIGVDATMDTTPLEISTGGTLVEIRHRRTLHYAIQFDHQLSSPKEFCKHIINFCLLGTPCTVGMTRKDERTYLSLHAENPLCSFKNLFPLNTLECDKTIVQAKGPRLIISMRNMRTIHQSIIRRSTVDISLDTDILGFVLDTHSIALVSDSNYDMCRKQIPV